MNEQLVMVFCTAIVGLLVYLAKDSQRRAAKERAESDARVREVTERSEARVREITDQFVAELRGNREAAIQRRIEDQEMHRGYQEVIREQTLAIEKQNQVLERHGQAVESLVVEVRQLAEAQERTVKKRPIRKVA